MPGGHAQGYGQVLRCSRGKAAARPPLRSRAAGSLSVGPRLLLPAEGWGQPGCRELEAKRCCCGWQGGTAPCAGTAAALRPPAPLGVLNPCTELAGGPGWCSDLERSGFGGGGLWCFLVFLCLFVLFVGGFGLGLLACFFYFFVLNVAGMNYLSPVLYAVTGGLPKLCTHAGSPGLILCSLGAAAGGTQQLAGHPLPLVQGAVPAVAPFPMLQLGWAALVLSLSSPLPVEALHCRGAPTGAGGVSCLSWSEVGPRSASTAPLLRVCASAGTPGPAPPRCLCEGPRFECKYFP